MCETVWWWWWWWWRVCCSTLTACRALVDEMEWAIAQVDPKKLIQTGSFRINPDGSQSVKDVKLFYFPAVRFVFVLLLLLVFQPHCTCFRFRLHVQKVISWSWWRECVRRWRITAKPWILLPTGRSTWGSRHVTARLRKSRTSPMTPESCPAWSLL